MTDRFRVGVISSTHGLQGEVKVFPTTDDPKRFRKLRRVFLQMGDTQKELAIAGVKFFKNMVILKFRGHDRIEDVAGYKGGELYIPREDAVRLGRDEYYVADLIGMEVLLEDGTVLGSLTDVIQTGANDVYSVRTEAHGDVLIPAIRQCIRSVDVEAGVMHVHLLDGMLD